MLVVDPLSFSIGMNGLGELQHFFSALAHGISRIDIAFVLAVMAFNILVARFGMWPYSLVTFPGNAGHELMHWFVAKLFFAQPAFPSLWPRRDGDRWVMGSVAFAPSILNAIPVALAPLLLLPLGVMFVSDFMHPATGWTYIFCGWVAGNVLFAALPSGQDWKIAAPSIMVFGLLGCAYYAAVRF